MYEHRSFYGFFGLIFRWITFRSELSKQYLFMLFYWTCSNRSRTNSDWIFPIWGETTFSLFLILLYFCIGSRMLPFWKLGQEMDFLRRFLGRKVSVDERFWELPDYPWKWAQFFFFLKFFSLHYHLLSLALCLSCSVLSRLSCSICWQCLPPIMHYPCEMNVLSEVKVFQC